MSKAALNRLGAVFYVLWGLLHFRAAYGVYLMGATMDAGILQGRIFQSAWNLAFFAAAAMIIAIFLNYRGSRTGYWINLIMLSVTDIGFFLLLVLPGYMPIIPGILGPALWILGALFTSLGYQRAITTIPSPPE